MAHTVRIYASWFLLWKIISSSRWALMSWVWFVWSLFHQNTEFWLHENEMISFQNNTFLSNLNPIFPKYIFLCRKKKKISSSLSPPASESGTLPVKVNDSVCGPDLVQMPLGWDFIKEPFSAIAIISGCLLHVSPFRINSLLKIGWTSLDPESCFYYCWDLSSRFPQQHLPASCCLRSSHTLVTPTIHSPGHLPCC